MQKPIIVCGVARSGTTFVRDLLKAHDKIVMSDEFFVQKMPHLKTFLEECEGAFPKRRGSWSDRKSEMMRAMWFLYSNNGVGRSFLEAPRFGNKTPGAEHYFEFYDWAFEADDPLYIYVLRRGDDLFLSRLNVLWGKVPSVKTQLRKYKDSIRAMEEFQATHPERLHVVQLDRLGSSIEDRRAFTESLFAFAGETLDAGVMQIVETWPKPNKTTRTERPADQPLLTALPDRFRRVMGLDPEYQELLERYGYETS